MSNTRGKEVGDLGNCRYNTQRLFGAVALSSIDADPDLISLQNRYWNMYLANCATTTVTVKNETSQDIAEQTESNPTPSKVSLGLLEKTKYVPLDKFIRSFETYCWLCKIHSCTHESFSRHVECKSHAGFIYIHLKACLVTMNESLTMTVSSSHRYKNPSNRIPNIVVLSQKSS